MAERSINELCGELLEKRALIEAGGGQKAVDFQHSKGKLTARERIALLLDEGSFVEIDEFIVHRCCDFGLSEKYFPGDGVVTGYGTVDGRTVYVYAQDFTVIGGSLGEMHSAKICKIQDLALKNGAPCIGINDSGGARIQEGIDSLSGFGKIFFRNVKASGIIPQLSVIAGTCAGGAVYSPALTDFVFMVNKTGVMHITGPAVIKAVTGESVTSEEIGGATAHNAVSGCAHFYAENEQDCFCQVRKLLSYIPSNNMEEAPYVETGDSTARADISLREAVPVDPNTPYDVRRVIETVFDNGEFFEVQPMFAKNMVTGFARLGGRSVGVIANQACELAGCIDIDAADKAGRFVRFCDAFNIPVVTFVDVPGYLPGRDQEMRGIIRHGAKLIYAYSEATIPKITVILRKAYGGSYIAMCCKELGADAVMAWPTARVAVMGAEGAAKIIFKHEIETADNKAAVRDEKIAEYRRMFENPYRALEHGHIDSVILPEETRAMIYQALVANETKDEQRPVRKHGVMPN